MTREQIRTAGQAARNALHTLDGVFRDPALVPHVEHAADFLAKAAEVAKLAEVLVQTAQRE